MKANSNITFFAVFSILIISIGNSLFAQISVSSEDVLGIIGTSSVVELDTTGSVTVDLGSSGANQVWDFTSNILEGTDYNFEYVVPEGTPLFAEYPEANMTQITSMTVGQTHSTMYMYLSVTPSQLIELGGGVFVTSPETTFQDLGGGSATPLPLNYENEWTVTKSDTTSFGEGILNIVKSVTHNKVDGWGKVKIPAGEYDCLRIREERSDTVKTVFLDQEIVIGGASSINYLWLGKENTLLVSIESQDDETDPNFTNAAGMSRLKSNSGANAIDLSHTITSPAQYQLDQNYPNPFNPTTKISFSLPESQHVKLSIFNSLGQQVRTILDESRNAGVHEVEFNAVDMPSGTYFYKIEAGSYNYVRKMLLIK